MTKRIVYSAKKAYTKTENDRYIDKISFKDTDDSGLIADISNPPEGYDFYPSRIDSWDVVRDMSLDPRFVIMHTFDGKKALAFFEIMPVAQCKVLKNGDKVQENKARRHSRCRIMSEKTGAEMFCPYDGEHSCANCEKSESEKNRTFIVPLEVDDKETGECITQDVADPNVDVEGDATVEEQVSELKDALRKLDMRSQKSNHPGRHLDVFSLRYDEEMSPAEVSEETDIPKSTITGVMNRIKDIAVELGIEPTEKK